MFQPQADSPISQDLEITTTGKAFTETRAPAPFAPIPYAPPDRPPALRNPVTAKDRRATEDCVIGTKHSRRRNWVRGECYADRTSLIAAPKLPLRAHRCAQEQSPHGGNRKSKNS